LSIEFYFSHRIEILLGKLIEELNSDDMTKDPFYSPMILVPNINITRWLQMNIAKKNKISINLDFKFLEEGLTCIIRNLKSDKTSDYIFLSHKENNLYLQLIIISIILKFNDAVEMKPINEYLQNVDGADLIRKIWQLSERLTFFFREYEYHRKTMVDRWLEDKYFFDNNDIEICEKFIYRKIFFEKEILKKFYKDFNKKFITLPQYSEEVFKNMDIFKTGKTVYIFCFSQISRYHNDLIFKLKDYYDIKIFLLSFLTEFLDGDENNWDKIANIKEEDSQLLYPDNYNELLKDWINPSRESIKIFSKYINRNNNKDFRSKWLAFDIKKLDAPSLLGLLQNDLLNKKLFDSKVKKITKQDESLQIIACKSIYREVETVYNSILHNLLDNGYKLTDIAVLVTDIKKYKTVIKSVFKKNPHNSISANYHNKEDIFLPYSLSDSSADFDSVFGNAVISGLQLAVKKISRKDVFDFILNPCFLYSQKLTRKDVFVWLEWIDKLNIYHSNQDGDLNSDARFHSWEYGLKRLRLGRIMESVKFDGKLYEFNKIIPYYDIKTSDYGALDKFIKVMEDLFNFIQAMQIKKTGGEWQGLLNNFIERFIKIPADIEEENIILYKLKSSFDKLLLFDKLLDYKIDIHYILEFIKTHLTNIPSRIGKYLSDGITISSLAPMRPIPFKVVYILGMNEGDFPGFMDNSTLDLRTLKRAVGDVTKKEANCYLFLETLLSVKEKLYITFIDKDIQKDEILYPSSICTKLINYINKSFLETEYEIIKSPLKGESSEYYTENISSDIKNYFYNERLLSLLYLKNKGFIPKKYERIIYDKYYSVIKNIECNIKKNNKKEIEEITLNDLYKFLLNPCEAKLSKLYDLYNENITDKTLKEDEPFYSDNIFQNTFILGVVDKYIENRDMDIDDFIYKFYEYNKYSGNTPEDIFSKYDRDKLKEDFFKRLYDDSGFAKYLDIKKDLKYIKKIIINDEYVLNENDESIINLPSLKLDGINLTGEFNHFFIDTDNTLIETFVFTNAKYSSNNIITKHIIKPFLFYLMLLNIDYRAGLFDSHNKEYGFCVNIFYKNDVKTYNFNILKNDAYNYIKDIMENFLSMDHFDFLPFDITSSKYFFPPKEIDYTNRLKDEIEKQSESKFSFFEKSQIFEIVNFEVPDDAFNKVSRWYKYFIEVL